MATQNTLTERQQEIQGLIDRGLTPPEVAKKLGISDNAVYQQLRRIRGGNGGAKAAPGSRTKAGRKAASKKRMRTSKPAPVPTLPTSPVSFPTPLQAVRARRTAIERELREANDATRTALAVAEKAKTAAKALHDKRAAELRQLTTAEGALAGAKKPSGRKSSRKPAARRPSSNGSAAQTGEPAGSSPPAGTPAAA